MKKSAGLLLFREKPELELLLAHMGGPFWAKKDLAAWSIPKGEFGDDEDPLESALREFKEEMGVSPTGDFIQLEPIKQAGGKLVYTWALRFDFDTSLMVSNTFSMEWPPRSGRFQEFPEIDRAEWFPTEIARQKILKGQAPVIDQLLRVLKTSS